MDADRMRTRAALCLSVKKLTGRWSLPAQLWHLIATVARDLGTEALERLAHRRCLRRVMLALRQPGQRA